MGAWDRRFENRIENEFAALIVEQSRDALRRKAGGNGHAGQPAAEQLSAAPEQPAALGTPAER